MFSPYIKPSNIHKKNRKFSNREKYPERPQMTPNDLKRPQLTSKKSFPETVKPKKNKLKGCSNFEIDDRYLDKFLHSNNL